MKIGRILPISAVIVALMLGILVPRLNPVQANCPDGSLSWTLPGTGLYYCGDQNNPTPAPECVDGWSFFQPPQSEVQVCQSSDGNQFYDPGKDPSGSCPMNNLYEDVSNCLTNSYPDTSPAVHRSPCKSALRKLECYAATAQYSYNDDVCFSAISAQVDVFSDPLGGKQITYPQTRSANGEPLYNSNHCKEERGKKECSERNKGDSKGWVYVRAFGSDPEKSCVSFMSFTTVLIEYALMTAALIAAGMFLMGGFKYTVSRGSPAALMEARDQILHATIGLILLAIAYIVILILQGAFGFLHLDLVGPFKYLYGG